MGARGEQIIQTDSGEVRLLYTNRALAQAEGRIGQGIVEILRDFETGGSISDVAELLRAGMQAARQEATGGTRPVRLQEAYEVLDDIGFAAAIEAVALGIAAVLGYGTEAEDIGDPNV